MILVIFALLVYLQFASSLEDNTVLGHRNSVVTMEDMSGSTIAGSHNTILNSTDIVVIGHNSSVENSSKSVFIGSELNLSNANDAMVIGHHITSWSMNTKLILGSYNAQSDAAFVLAHGTPEERSNLLEIDSEGMIHSAQMQSLFQTVQLLTERVESSERRLAEMEQSYCASLSCTAIKSAYHSKQCCPS